MGAGAGCEDPFVCFELLPGDVARMGAQYQCSPVFWPEFLTGDPAVWWFSRSALLIGDAQAYRRLCQVSRTLQCLAASRSAPLRGVTSTLVPERARIVSEGLHSGSGGPGASEGGEEVSERVLHAGIGIDGDPSCPVVDEAHRKQ